MTPGIGIFWFYQDHIIEKSTPHTIVKPGPLNIIDSDYTHHKEWEYHHIYLPQFPELIDTEYQSLPRGRVVYDCACQQSRVYLDKTLLTQQHMTVIVQVFTIEPAQCAWFKDPHYRKF